MFRKLAHLREQLGEGRFMALIDPENTGKVREFCDSLPLPAEMIISSRTYQIMDFMRKGEKSVRGCVMVERAKKMQANLGQGDGQYLLDHQEEIPVTLRGRVAFVFPDWRKDDDPEYVIYIAWDGNRWVKFWGWLPAVFYINHRLLRPKPAPPAEG